MNTWVEAPPRKGLGCFGRGCLILLVFLIVLAIACFAGIYWGLHRHPECFYGNYWLAKTRSRAEAPTSVPEFSASDQQIQLIRERWQDFEQKALAGQPAEIELSADDINALIATSEDVRGKVFISIDRNLLHLQVSVPIGEFLCRPGYYFNGDVVIELKGVQSLDSPQFSRITINGEQVPTDFLKWKYRSRELREYLAEQGNAYEVGTIEIRDGKVILRSRTQLDQRLTQTPYSLDPKRREPINSVA